LRLRGQPKRTLSTVSSGTSSAVRRIRWNLGVLGGRRDKPGLGQNVRFGPAVASEQFGPLSFRFSFNSGD
jgi:hypothetical protein